MFLLKLAAFNKGNNMAQDLGSFQNLTKGITQNFTQSPTENLSILKNNELHSELQNRVTEERRLTHQILLLIIEIDQRKLFLPMASSSLFDYLVKMIGYAPASAQRRIDAARMMQQVPELGKKIEEGSLKLTQISQVQHAIRLVQKKGKTQILPSEKKQLLAKLENKTGAESELILAQEFDLPIQTQVIQKIQRDESVRVEWTFSKEQMETLTRAKELLCHALPGATLTEVIASLAERYVKQRTGVKTPAKQKDSSSQSLEPSQSQESSLRQESNSAEEVTGCQKSSQKTSLKFSQKPVPSSVKKVILSSSEGCQFKDSTTGRICGTKHFLQVDHIQPRFAGGGNEPTNLRALCSSHNQYHYTAGC
jgi:hypothetical protein